MKMSKLSNQTNSQDPQAVNSRIFVGNLNTFQCSKTDVERMFEIYGRLAGISMHKGYAFVQYTNPFDARNACLGEDGKTVLNQTLDVNMVAEPKPHQVGRKRQNMNKTGNDWDFFYDSYYSSAVSGGASIHSKKRKRLSINSSRLLSLSDAVAKNGINASVSAAALAQQYQHQQRQQPNHHSHQHQQQQQQQQQQVAAVAMTAMANLLPQRQVLLHQPALLTNTNGSAASTTTCNGSMSASHHTNLNFCLHHHQHQQQQQQVLKQQQAATAEVVAAAQYAAAVNSSLQLKMSSPMINESVRSQQSSNSSSPISPLAVNGSDQSAVLTNSSQLLHSQSCANMMQPLSLSLSPHQPHRPPQQQQQQQHQVFQKLHMKQATHFQLYNQQTMQQRTQPEQQNNKQIENQNHNQNQNQLQLQNQQQKCFISNKQWGPFKVYSNPDTLICGNCRECFNDLPKLLDHKRSYCKLRFTCRCNDLRTATTKKSLRQAQLLCAVCKDAFINPWELMVHAQAAHMVNIYELDGNECDNDRELLADGSNTTPNVSQQLQQLQQLHDGSHDKDNDSNNNNNIRNHNKDLQLTPVISTSTPATPATLATPATISTRPAHPSLPIVRNPETLQRLQQTERKTPTTPTTPPTTTTAMSSATTSATSIIYAAIVQPTTISTKTLTTIPTPITNSITIPKTMATAITQSISLTARNEMNANNICPANYTTATATATATDNVDSDYSISDSEANLNASINVGVCITPANSFPAQLTVIE